MQEDVQKLHNMIEDMHTQNKGQYYSHETLKKAEDTIHEEIRSLEKTITNEKEVFICAVKHKTHVQLFPEKLENTNIVKALKSKFDQNEMRKLLHNMKE